jgi:hypothetical protein
MAQDRILVVSPEVKAMGVERDIETEEIIARSRRIKAQADELLRQHRELQELKSAQMRADRLARMTPEARERWRTLLAGVKQHTKDDERRERQARMRGQGDLLEDN